MTVERKGVDISYANGDVDFNALKAAGIEFVIIRCGYGSDYTSQDDSQFSANVAKAEAAGIPWGTYLYSYARDTDMAKSEAKHTLRLLAGRKPAYGVWYDVEDDQQSGCNLEAIALAYCQEIEAAGLYVGIYSMLNWMQRYFSTPALAKYDKWVAQWANSCSYSGPYGMWQFTDSYSIKGKDFDGNRAYKDYPALTGGTSTVSTKSRVLATQENQITNPFGNGHSGVDLGWQTTQTDDILAHSEGTVVFCQTGQSNNQGSTGNASYGNCVKLQHPNGYFTLYAHLSEVNVSYGEQVGQGKKIGKMGNTGNSYGNHLHFEVRNPQNTCIDPTPYIAADLPGLVTETVKEEHKVNLDEFIALWREMRKGLQDNDASEYSEEARQWAVNSGLIAGGTTGGFNGMWEDVLTREQFVTVLYRFAKMAGLT